MNHLVLVENEVTYGGKYDHWRDLTGVSYQFPNQYRNKVNPGKQFVYYRGVRRANKRRGQAEYFGVGHIASVWRDPSVPENAPKSSWRWYCSIEDYIPFPQSVPSRVDGQYLEPITNSLGWRTGVREISDNVFQRIISLAGLQDSDDLSSAVATSPTIPMPDINGVIPVEMPDGINYLMRAENPASQPSSNKTITSYRRSKRSKQIGDRAEEVVLKWLATRLPPALASTVAWAAQQGKRPGWDIEFIDEDNETVAIEVKGTTANVFQSIEITAQEWNSAREKRGKYWLAIVTNCLSVNPTVAVIVDPFKLTACGNFEIEPALWRIKRTSGQ